MVEPSASASSLAIGQMVVISHGQYQGEKGAIMGQEGKQFMVQLLGNLNNNKKDDDDDDDGNPTELYLFPSQLKPMYLSDSPRPGTDKNNSSSPTTRKNNCGNSSNDNKEVKGNKKHLKPQETIALSLSPSNISTITAPTLPSIIDPTEIKKYRGGILEEGHGVRIVGGTYRGQRGMVVEFQRSKILVRLEHSNEEVLLMRKNLGPWERSTAYCVSKQRCQRSEHKQEKDDSGEGDNCDAYSYDACGRNPNQKQTVSTSMSETSQITSIDKTKSYDSSSASSSLRGLDYSQTEMDNDAVVAVEKVSSSSTTADSGENHTGGDNTKESIDSREESITSVQASSKSSSHECSEDGTFTETMNSTGSSLSRHISGRRGSFRRDSPRSRLSVQKADRRKRAVSEDDNGKETMRPSCNLTITTTGSTAPSRASYEYKRATPTITPLEAKARARTATASRSVFSRKKIETATSTISSSTFKKSGPNALKTRYTTSKPTTPRLSSPNTATPKVLDSLRGRSYTPRHRVQNSPKLSASTSMSTPKQPTADTFTFNTPPVKNPNSPSITSRPTSPPPKEFQRSLSPMMMRRRSKANIKASMLAQKKSASFNENNSSPGKRQTATISPRHPRDRSKLCALKEPRAGASSKEITKDEFADESPRLCERRMQNRSLLQYATHIRAKCREETANPKSTPSSTRKTTFGNQEPPSSTMELVAQTSSPIPKDMLKQEDAVPQVKSSKDPPEKESVKLSSHISKEPTGRKEPAELIEPPSSIDKDSVEQAMVSSNSSISTTKTAEDILGDYVPMKTFSAVQLAKEDPVGTNDLSPTKLSRQQQPAMKCVDGTDLSKSQAETLPDDDLRGMNVSTTVVGKKKQKPMEMLVPKFDETRKVQEDMKDEIISSSSHKSDERPFDEPKGKTFPIHKADELEDDEEEAIIARYNQIVQRRQKRQQEQANNSNGPNEDQGTADSRTISNEDEGSPHNKTHSCRTHASITCDDETRFACGRDRTQAATMHGHQDTLRRQSLPPVKIDKATLDHSNNDQLSLSKDSLLALPPPPAPPLRPTPPKMIHISIPRSPPTPSSPVVTELVYDSSVPAVKITQPNSAPITNLIHNSTSPFAKTSQSTASSVDSLAIKSLQQSIHMTLDSFSFFSVGSSTPKVSEKESSLQNFSFFPVGSPTSKKSKGQSPMQPSSPRESPAAMPRTTRLRTQVQSSPRTTQPYHTRNDTHFQQDRCDAAMVDSTESEDSTYKFIPAPPAPVTTNESIPSPPASVGSSSKGQRKNRSLFQKSFNLVTSGRAVSKREKFHPGRLSPPLCLKPSSANKVMSLSASPSQNMSSFAATAGIASSPLAVITKQCLMNDKKSDKSEASRRNRWKYKLQTSVQLADEQQQNLHGASWQQILLLPTKTLSQKDIVEHRSNKEEQHRHSCQLCSKSFVTRDVVRTLPCGHDFHTGCIDKQLFQDTDCPTCKRPAVMLEI